MGRPLLLFLGMAAVRATDMGPNLWRLFTDVSAEADVGTALAIQGELPEWLRFTRYSNGFGKFGGWNDPSDSPFTFNYLFDCLSYVQQFEISAGQVTFGTKLLNSSVLQDSTSTIPPFRTFGGTTPGMDRQQWMHTLVGTPTSDNLNVNVVRVNEGNILAVSDMTGYFEVDADTLASKGSYAWGEADPIASNELNIITSAHPTRLPGDRYMYNYHVEIFGGVLPNATDDVVATSAAAAAAAAAIPTASSDSSGLNKIRFWRMDMESEGPLEREVIFETEQSRISYCHQVSQTPQYLVFVEYPLLWAIQDIPRSEAMLRSLVWRPNLGTRFRLINKETGEVDFDQTIDDAIFAYHQVNAFEVTEDDGSTLKEVVVDILTVPCANSSGPANCNHMNAFNLDTLRDNSFEIPAGPLLRYTLPMAAEVPARRSKIGAPRVLSTNGLDLTSIHPDKHGKSHRYMWALGNEGDGVWYNKIVKLDLEPALSKEARGSGDDPAPTVTEWYKYDHYPAEVFFVPRPGADLAEDDGVLLSVVLDGAANHSYLLALDAATLQPIAQANTSFALPFVSHGQTCTEERGCWSGA